MYLWPSYWYSYLIAMRCWKEQKFALFFRIVFTFHSKRIKFIWTRWVDSTSTQWYHSVYLCIFKFAQLNYLPFEFKIWGHYTCWHMCLAFIMISNNASMTYVSRENNILNLCCCGRIRTYWEWSTNTMSINNVLS